MTAATTVSQSNAFSIATLLYARLRRVSGRVVDALFMVENKDYARYVANLALNTDDPELSRLVARLYTELELSEISDVVAVETKLAIPKLNEDDEQYLYASEPTAEDIYKAQVSHRYIGALR